MKILVIGGTRFVGPPVVQELMDKGYDVTLFHRGQTEDDRIKGVQTLLGDRKQLSQYVEQFKEINPDVVLDMTPFTPDDAKELMEVMKGITPRVVALSSIDVYLAYGRLHRTEPGPIQPIPLHENASLRETDKPHGYQYDKISVEKFVMGSQEISGTILRLPAIYGPKDYQHRMFSHIKRMDDKRPAILLEEGFANWRFSHGFVENVAHAIVLAVENEKARGQIYNVAELETPTERERVVKISQLTNWNGKILTIPKNQCPAHLDMNMETNQHWVVDTSKIREELGFKEIISEDEALKRTMEWERANPPKEVDPKRFDYETEDGVLNNLNRASTFVRKWGGLFL